MLRNLRVSHKLPLLVAVMGAALTICAIASFVVLDGAKVGGDGYRQIARDNELLADVLPPPAYLVEADLVAYQVTSDLNAADDAAVSADLARLDELEQSYRERIAYWQRELTDAGARDALLDRSVPAATAFFTVLHDQVAPAARAGDATATAIAVTGALQDAYRTHRAAIDEVVARSTETAAAHESSIAARVRRSTVALLVVLVAALATGVVLSRLVARSITAPLAALQRGLEAVAAGDANAQAGLDTDRADELGSLAVGFTTFAEAMQQQVVDLDERAGQLASAALAMEQAAEEVRAGMETVAAATVQMDASIVEIARTASEAAHEAIATVGSVDESLSSIQRLQDSSGRIAEAVLTIGQVTDQTHLLALNAHIEAEHAGASGRGFAAVAHEVKELARRTGSTSASIGSVVSRSGEDVFAAMSAMDAIRRVIGDVQEGSSVIAAAVEEQTATMREIVMQVQLTAGRGVEIRDAVRHCRAVTGVR